MVIAPPIDTLEVGVLRAELVGLVGSLGVLLKSHPGDRVGKILHGRLFSQLLLLTVDPVAEAIGGFFSGVTSGVDGMFPRVPAIYNRKVLWRSVILDEAERVELKDPLDYVFAAMLHAGVRKLIEAAWPSDGMIRYTFREVIQGSGTNFRVGSLGTL